MGILTAFYKGLVFIGMGAILYFGASNITNGPVYGIFTIAVLVGGALWLFNLELREGVS